MADNSMALLGMTEADRDDDPVARQIDLLMSGPPADLPAIVVVGDDAVFGIRPVRRGLEHPQGQPDGEACAEI